MPQYNVHAKHQLYSKGDGHKFDRNIFSVFNICNASERHSQYLSVNRRVVSEIHDSVFC